MYLQSLQHIVDGPVTYRFETPVLILICIMYEEQLT